MVHVSFGSVRQKCLDQQRRRRQRATKKISTFIGTFVVCFTPYVITRIVELFFSGTISPHWGVLTKCLAYSKAASDPFVYSLLRHQYRTTCSQLANKVLKRSPLHSASRRLENGMAKRDTNPAATANATITNTTISNATITNSTITIPTTTNAARYHHPNYNRP